MNSFFEALKNGFEHITDITDRTALRQFRLEGIKVDEEGYYRYCFGEHKQYELCIEPIGEYGQYQVALYKNRVLLTKKLSVWIKED